MKRIFSSMIMSAMDDFEKSFRKNTKLFFKNSVGIKDISFKGFDVQITFENKNNDFWTDQVIASANAYKKAFLKNFSDELTACKVSKSMNEEGDLVFNFSFERAVKGSKKKNLKSSLTQDFITDGNPQEALAEFDKIYHDWLEYRNDSDIDFSNYDMEGWQEELKLWLQDYPIDRDMRDYAYDYIMERGSEVEDKTFNADEWFDNIRYELLGDESIANDTNDNSEQITQIMAMLNEANLPDDKKQELLLKLSELTGNQNNTSTVASSKIKTTCETILASLDKLEDLFNAKDVDKTLLKNVYSAYNAVLIVKDSI